MHPINWTAPRVAHLCHAGSTARCTTTSLGQKRQDKRKFFVSNCKKMDRQIHVKERNKQ
jgi:hypothetical protein